MKKIFYIICLMFLVISCKEKSEGVKSEEYHSVREFEYNDHEYIKFNLYANRAGVVHNPDCKCYKKEK